MDAELRRLLAEWPAHANPVYASRIITRSNACGFISVGGYGFDML